MRALPFTHRHRINRLVERLHVLGSRPVAELLIELAIRADCMPMVLALLDAYAALTPRMMVAAHADWALSHPMSVVS